MAFDGAIASDYFPVAGGWFYNVNAVIQNAGAATMAVYVSVEYYDAAKVITTASAWINYTDTAFKAGLFHPVSYTITVPTNARFCRIIVSHDPAVAGPIYVDSITIAAEHPWGPGLATAAASIPQGAWTEISIDNVWGAMGQGFRADTGAPGGADALMMFHLSDGKFYAPQPGFWEFYGQAGFTSYDYAGGAGLTPPGTVIRARTALLVQVYDAAAGTWSTGTRQFQSGFTDNAGAGDPGMPTPVEDNAAVSQVHGHTLLGWGDAVTFQGYATTNNGSPLHITSPGTTAPGVPTYLFARLVNSF